MSEWPFVDSPWFPVATAGVLLLLTALAGLAGAPSFLVWALIVVAFPFCIEVGGWEHAVRHGSRVYKVEWSRVHDGAYSPNGSLPRYLFGWIYLTAICVVREFTSLDDHPIAIPLIIVPTAIWIGWCWVAHYRAIRVWAQENGLRSRWATDTSDGHIGWGAPSTREGKLIAIVIVAALTVLISFLAYGFAQAP